MRRLLNYDGFSPHILAKYEGTHPIDFPGEIIECEDSYCIYIPYRVGDELTYDKEVKKHSEQNIIVCLKKHVIKWLAENIGKDNWCFDEYSMNTIAFVEVESAIAFKLRWL